MSVEERSSQRWMRYDPAFSVVRSFGGPKVLSEALGIPWKTISHWFTDRGQGRIPKKYVAPMLELARLKGIPLTLEQITAEPSPIRS